jgi:hypothetical protein
MPSSSPFVRAARRVLSALLLAVLVSAGAVQAQQIVYTTAVPFLQIEPDSRAAGMGNSGVALADNASAIFWNPAGLAQQRGAEVSLTHAPWLPAITSDLFYEYLVGKYHFEGIGTFGAHITFLNLGEQENRDGGNVLLGTFRSYELATGVSYGRQITERFALGTGARFIYSNLTGGATLPGVGVEGKAGLSFGFDLAGLYAFKPFDLGSVPVTTKLGFNLANMGPAIGYTEGGREDPIPTNLRFGGAVSAQLDEFNKINFSLDFNKVLVDFEQVPVRDSLGNEVFDPSGNPVTETQAKSFAEAIFSSWKSVRVCSDPGEDLDDCENVDEVGVLRQITVGTGLEYWYNDLFAFRTGFFYEDPNNGNRKYLTFGAGIRYNLIGVDFSYIYPLEEDSPLANTLRFSLLLNILR